MAEGIIPRKSPGQSAGHQRHRPVPVVLFILFLLVVRASTLLAGVAESPRKVLVLHSYHAGLSWTDSLVKGIGEGLAESGMVLDIAHEFMDTKRIFSEQYLDRLAALYALKFRDSHIDVIVATDDLAFNFLRKHHGRLFPGKPVVFCGVNSFQDDMLEGLPTFTGVLEAFDMPATLEAALQLQPQATRFVVISDQTLTGTTNKPIFLEAIQKLSRPMDVLLLENHTMDEVRAEVSRLDMGDIAVWLSFTTDRAGNYYDFRRSATLISEVSGAPLYSFWDFHLGYGIAGGKLASGYFQGRLGAQLATRILAGEPAASIAVVKESPNRFMFDFLQLQRFNIDPETLPAGSIVINTSVTLYSQYKHLVWGVAGGFFALSSIIALLLVNAANRRRANSSLTLSENRFRTLFDSAASGIALVGLEGRYLRVNDALCSMLGFSREELERKNWQDVTCPEDTERTRAMISEILSGHPAPPMEKRYLHKNGQLVWALMSVGLNIDRDGKPLNYVSQVQDITRMKQVQAEMHQSVERYRQIFEADLSGFFLASPSGKVLLCNKIFAGILGLGSVAEAVGKNISTFYRNADFWAKLANDLADGVKVENIEVELLRDDGETITVLCNGIGRYNEGRLVEVQGHMMDISRQKKLETQLVRAQKMEAIGLMAGGVAHDLNNILSGIINYPELMLAKLDKDSHLRKPLESVRESGQRAATVVADLLTVARSAANVRESHNVHTLVREYLDSPEFNRLCSLYPHVTIDVECLSENSTILCSPVHIKKCLMNLVTNAMEAIEDKGQVLLAIREETKSAEQGGRTVPCDYVVVDVTDNGPGISEKDRERIFEPFYTKKVMGKSGTGLGLAVVWNTAQEHGGKITIASDARGTTFSLSLPRYSMPALASAKEMDEEPPPGRGERVLVVDDEPTLRDIADQILTAYGYHVTVVGSGEEAIAFLRQEKVDLVLLDMFMEPGINGCLTYEKIISIHPRQKAIIASGFSKSEDVKKAMRLGVGNFIEKPYSASLLGWAVFRELQDS